jgi:hypothetical protein
MGHLCSNAYSIIQAQPRDRVNLRVPRRTGERTLCFHGSDCMEPPLSRVPIIHGADKCHSRGTALAQEKAKAGRKPWPERSWGAEHTRFCRSKGCVLGRVHLTVAEREMKF